MTTNLGNVLIFGGTGFFGKSLVNYLNSEMNFYSDAIYLTAREPKKYQSIFPFDAFENVNIIDFDLGGSKMNPELESLNFDYIIHAAAASTDVLGLSSLDRYRQIVFGTEKILKYVKDFQPLAKVLYVSSGGVYGEMPEKAISFSENMNTIPAFDDKNNTYSISKRMAEHLCFLYADQFSLKVTIARCFAFSGRFLPLDVHFAIGNFINNCLNSEPIVIQGNGLPVRSYMYAADMTKAILQCLNTKSSMTINIGSDEKISIKNLAILVSQILKNPNVVIKDQTNHHAYNLFYVH